MIKALSLKKRSKRFFLHNAEYVAQKILGDYLVVKDKRHTLVGKIVETEAYYGSEDPASDRLVRPAPPQRLLTPLWASSRLPGFAPSRETESLLCSTRRREEREGNDRPA